MTAIATASHTGGGDSLPVLELNGESTSPLKLGRDLWVWRELLVLLARKEFHVKYRRMSFGTMWAVALPLLQSLVMATVFSRLVRFSVPHYAAFMLSGMAAWTYFSTVFPAGSTAIAGNSALSTKVYFPRALLPLVQATTALYGLVIMLAIVLILSVPLGAHLGAAALLFVPGVVLLVAFTSSLVLTAAALQVYFRDVGYIANALVLLLMYLSPVIYPPSLAPHIVQPVLTANPMTGILDLFHAAIGVHSPLLLPLVVTGLWSAGLWAAAVVLHSRFDRVFTDLL
ncbi:MAG TPA: hypothetical protein DCQ30_12915 [Acidimicrobiaceae bacterium]|nr:hypothetical protein [Acidimicrobiaceae bacterium]